MDTLSLLLALGGTIVGALAGAAACYWPLSRSIADLRGRLERSEQARNGAVERSAQAREQIAQLNRAITELRRTHISAPAATQASARDAVEKALAEGDKRTLPQLRQESPQAFADTQVLGNTL